MRSLNEWRQSYWGTLPDGSRVMLVTVRAKRGSRNFQAVLVCSPDGLYRLWRNGRQSLLAQGYSWPTNCKRQRDGLATLKSLVPQHWGDWHDSLNKQIPNRLLTYKTENVARLLIAWYRTTELIDSARITGMWKPLFPLSIIPASRPWRPLVITTLPITELVVEALYSGALLYRLKLGMERIYISEMAWTKAPTIKTSLFALANRFPERLVLVKVTNDRPTSGALRVKKERAYEYQFVGYQLQEAYETEFDYDKYNNPKALDGMYRFKVGEPPRGIFMIFVHEREISFEQWERLDSEGILAIEKLSNERRAKVIEKGSEMLGEILTQTRAS